MLLAEFNGVQSQVVLKTEGENNAPVILVRKALLFVEGDHTDSKLRGHTFSAERVRTIFNNTNAKLEKGGVIPVVLDHDRSAKSVVGAIQQPLILREISAEDLPNLVNGSKLEYLIGKLGIFSDEVILKDKSIIESFLSDKVRTISPGIDLRADVIREVSLVATPAIPGLSLYSSLESNEEIHYFNISPHAPSMGDFMTPYTYGNVYTLNEALAEKQKIDNEKSKFMDTASVLWDILVNIKKAGYDENESMALIVENLQQFVAKVLEILNVSYEEPQQPVVASNVPQEQPANYSAVPNDLADDENTIKEFITIFEKIKARKAKKAGSGCRRVF